MSRLFWILMLTILFSCSQKQNSIFFENCGCDKIDLSKGIWLTDSLRHFSFLVPDSTWKPNKLLTETENGLTVGDTSAGFIRLVNITETDYNGKWAWQEEQKSTQRDFDIKLSGEIKFNRENCRWNLVSFDKATPPMYSLYLTIVDSIKMKFYTINMSVEKSENFKTNICELEAVIQTFVRNK